MKKIKCVLLGAAIFSVGLYVGATSQTVNSSPERIIAIRIYNEIKANYGGVRFDQPEYKNVLGTIHLYKDIDLAIYQDNGVRSVRAYEF